MHIYFDTEFIDDGKTIELISIGMVRADGAWLYMENKECDLSGADPWILENVVPKLHGKAVSYAEIGRQVQDFVGPNPTFWAYYPSYDWVALCQLYGRMLDIPKGWPKYCLDVKQEAVRLGITSLPKQTTPEHHALNDALWTKQAYEYCQQ